MDKKFKVGDIKKVVKESIKNNIPSDTKSSQNTSSSINKKATKDSIKNATEPYKDMDLTIKDVKKNDEQEMDLNKINLNLVYDTEPSEQFKDRIKDEVENTGTDEENNESNKDFYKTQSEKNVKMDDAEKEIKKAGLVGSQLPDEVFDHKKQMATKIKESTIKRLHFKNTKFLNEEHMFNFVPDTYKFVGSRFIMEDKEGTEYLIEWKELKIGDGTASNGYVKSVKNKEKLNEEFDRIQKLMGYKSTSITIKNSSQNKEDLYEMVDISRKTF